MSELSFYEEQAAWMQERCGKFTASEIHKLLEKGRQKEEYFGKGAHTYIRTKLAEILTGNVVELTNIRAMEWGNAHELEAVLLLEKYLQTPVNYWGKANPKFIPFTDYSGGSPDGEVPEKDALAEIKCPENSANHIQFLLMEDQQELKKESPDYYAQMQFNMMAAKVGLCYFASYDPRMSIPELRLKVIEVYADTALQENLLERVTEAEKFLKVIYSSLNEAQEAA